MKKQTLSIEQMKRFQAMGVDTSNASIVLLFYDDDGNLLDWSEVPSDYEKYKDGPLVCLSENGDEIHPHYFDADTGMYDHSYKESCGVFTIHDLLNMLPKCLRFRDPEAYAYLNIICLPGGGVSACYMLTNGKLVPGAHCTGADFMEAIYKLTIWFIKNKKGLKLQ